MNGQSLLLENNMQTEKSLFPLFNIRLGEPHPRYERGFKRIANMCREIYLTFFWRDLRVSHLKLPTCKLEHMFANVIPKIVEVISKTFIHGFCKTHILRFYGSHKKCLFTCERAERNVTASMFNCSVFSDGKYPMYRDGLVCGIYVYVHFYVNLILCVTSNIFMHKVIASLTLL